MNKQIGFLYQCILGDMIEISGATVTDSEFIIETSDGGTIEVLDNKLGISNCTIRFNDGLHIECECEISDSNIIFQSHSSAVQFISATNKSGAWPIPRSCVK